MEAAAEAAAVSEHPVKLAELRVVVTLVALLLVDLAVVAVDLVVTVEDMAVPED